jgi:hypothetical protein
MLKKQLLSQSATVVKTPQPNRSSPSQVVSIRNPNNSVEKGRTNYTPLHSPYNLNTNSTLEGNLDVDDFFDFDDSFNNQTVCFGFQLPF